MTAILVDTITGRTLMGWGFEPGPWFGAAVHEAETLLSCGAS